MSGTLRLRGTTSGYSELQAPAIAGDQTFILPAVGGTLLTTASPAPTLTLELGTVTSPSLTFEGDLNTGIYSPGANQIAITTGGGQRLYVGSDGRVGIGTGSPDAQLKVQAPNSDSITSAFAVRQNNAADSAQATCLIEQDPVNSSSRIIANGTTTPSLKLGTAGNIAVTINSSQQVGIGTSVPIVPLHVIGNQLFEGDMEVRPPSSGSEGGQITLKNPGGSTIGATIDISTADSFRIFQLNDNSTMELGQLSGTGGTVRFATSGSERMRINSSGNVGIGTSSPETSLHVDGTTATPVVFESSNSQSLINFRNSSTSLFFMGASSNNWNVQTNGVERLSVTTTGNVGVGTSNPTTLLHLQKNTGAIINLGTGTSTASSTQGLNFYARFINGVTPATPGQLTSFIREERQGNNAKFDLTFGTATTSDATEKVRITSQGYLLQGTTNLGTVGSVNGFQASNHIAAASVTNSIFSRRTTNGAVVQFRRDTTAVGNITVTTTSTSYGTSSDYRLKENVVDLDGAIDRVKQLTPKRFNFIADADTVVDGFLAHEAQVIVPEAVTGTKDDVDDEGNAVMQGIDQSKFVPLLTAALKEAIAKIETLETKVAALETSA